MSSSTAEPTEWARKGPAASSTDHARNEPERTFKAPSDAEQAPVAISSAQRPRCRKYHCLRGASSMRIHAAEATNGNSKRYIYKYTYTHT